MICGLFKHTESFCPLAYSSTGAPPRLYDESIRAVNRRFLPSDEDKWLREEEGSPLMEKISAAQAQSMPQLEDDVSMQIQATCQQLQAHKIDENRSIPIDTKRKRTVSNSSPMFIDAAPLPAQYEANIKASSDERAREEE